MQAIYKMSASAVMAAMLLSGCSSLNSGSNMNKGNMATVSQMVPVAQTGFRYSAAENFDIANKDRLAKRVFYDEPSTGPDAKWFDAIKKGDLATVKYMVKNGQNLEAKDSDKQDQTALGWAAFIGYEDIVDYLISEGASVYATDKGDVYNTLKSAALGKNTRVVQKLYTIINAQAPIDLNDQMVENDGETLIMVAASNNRFENVKFLLAKGANPNLVATTKDTTLYAYDQGAYSYACTRGLVEMQKLLAANGAINHRTGKASCE